MEKTADHKKFSVHRKIKTPNLKRPGSSKKKGFIANNDSQTPACTEDRPIIKYVGSKTNGERF